MRVRSLFAALSFALAAVSSAAIANVESPRLQQLERDLQRPGKTAALDGFWREVAVKQTPLIEPVPGRPEAMRLTFLFKAPDDKTPVHLGVFGVFNDHPWETGDAFEHLAGSNLWYRSYVLPARLSSPYLLIGTAQGLARQRAWENTGDDGKPRSLDLFLDPLNRRTIDDVYFTPLSRDNLFAGPAAPPERWLAGMAPRGRVTELSIDSAILGNRRKVLVYTPPGIARMKQPPGLLLLFDGLSYRTPGMVPEMLDRLIAAKRIPPLAAVMVDFVSLPNRQVELAANDRFSDFVARELLPRLYQKFRLSRDPARAIVGGASRGGLAASYMAFRYPELFGNVIGQSSALWWGPTPEQMDKDWLAGRYAASPRLPVRFVLQAGSLETDEGMRGPNRRFAEVLRARGYAVCHGEFLGGHTFLHWRMNLPAALIALTAPGEGLVCPQVGANSAE